MASDNNEKILNEYLEKRGKLFKEYVDNHIKCGDDISKVKALGDKQVKEEIKIFGEYLRKMIEPWRDESPERLMHEAKLAGDILRRNWEKELNILIEKL